MKRESKGSTKPNRLICPACHNKDRFIEVMDVETHLVNGQKDYIRLLEGIPGRYLCWECGDLVETAAKPTLTVNQEATARRRFLSRLCPKGTTFASPGFSSHESAPKA